MDVHRHRKYKQNSDDVTHHFFAVDRPLCVHHCKPNGKPTNEEGPKVHERMALKPEGSSKYFHVGNGKDIEIETSER